MKKRNLFACLLLAGTLGASAYIGISAKAASTTTVGTTTGKVAVKSQESIDSWMPDKVLQKYILDYLKTNGTLPSDATVNDITKESMTHVEHVTLQSEWTNVRSYEGLQYATNLESFMQNATTPGEKITDLGSFEPFAALKHVNSVKMDDFAVTPGAYAKLKPLVDIRADKPDNPVFVFENSQSQGTYHLTLNDKNYRKFSIPASEINDLAQAVHKIAYPANPSSYVYENNSASLNLTLNKTENVSYSGEYDGAGKYVFTLMPDQNVTYKKLSGLKFDSSEINSNLEITGSRFSNDSIYHEFLIYNSHYVNDVSFAPETTGVSDLKDLYTQVKSSIWNANALFATSPANSLKYKTEFSNRSMFGALDNAYNTKNRDLLIDMMHTSLSKLQKSISTLQVNQEGAKKQGLDVSQLESDRDADAVPYDYSQDNDIEGIQQELAEFNSMRSKYTKLVQQGVFDKSSYWNN